MVNKKRNGCNFHKNFVLFFNEYKRYKLTEDILLKISEYTKDNIQELFKDSINYKLLESEDNEFYILKTNIHGR